MLVSWMLERSNCEQRDDNVLTNHGDDGSNFCVRFLFVGGGIGRYAARLFLLPKAHSLLPCRSPAENRMYQKKETPSPLVQVYARL